MNATESPPVLAGLTAGEAAGRLERDGPNRIPEPPRPGAIRQIFAQLTHFFALLLWVGGILAIVGGMAELGIAIFIVIVVNAIFAFAQQSRAERAAEKLRDLLPRRVTARRDGIEVEIDASELVTDDVVLLADGDRVSADLDLIAAAGLEVDSSLLSGESVPEQVAVGDRLHAGTFVTQGRGEAIVAATGSHTRLAEIASLTQGERHRKTPLAIELDRVVRIVALIAVVVGTAFFGVSLLVGTPAGDGFLFAIGVTVALVPEGLLPTVTLSLAMGAQRMAARNGLVRRLESVETLGSATVICTDKTGTLTRNEMTITRVWVDGRMIELGGAGYDPTRQLDLSDTDMEAVSDLARAAWWTSVGWAECVEGRWVAHGDPMEVAIDVLARRCGAEPLLRERAVVELHPFDPHRRRASALVELGGETGLAVKGAPEAVVVRCSGAAGSVNDAVAAMASGGLRVLAVASRVLEADESLSTTDPDAAENGLTLVGLLGFRDPPREGTAQAIARCRDAGISLMMLTGDHPLTAAAIGTEIGLHRRFDPVVDGMNLPAEDDALGRLVDHDGTVISRIAPEDKLRVATVLQARGHVVAMTGDGVNDGPALHAADIGVAMGRGGTDVARAAADLVLLDDEFSTIVSAVDQGRATFADIRRFLTYHLSDNVAELTPFVLWAITGGRFPLAIGVLQVLCLDIGTDLLPALALGAEPSHPQGPHPQRGKATLRRHLFDRTVMRRAFGVLGPVEAAVEIAAFVTSMWFSGWRPGDTFPTGSALATASGAAFSAVVLGQCANAFACRSTILRPGRLGWFRNRLLVGAVLSEVVALCGFLFIGPLARTLGHRPPSAAGFLVAAMAVPAVLVADAIDKAIRRRRPLGQ
ncbi:MAG: cation-transporting P-type ATPase [Microthrixaceae bacterium]|nr:cation-transporting P-type ATPase [Microthrixaceae bacterium]